MNAHLLKTLTLLMLFCSLYANGSNLSDDARDRGINENCSFYLNQIEKSYNLNGLNITFAHPDNPSELSSLHVSSQKYNNGASSFSATLMPDNEYCYLSIILVTAINNQSCAEIAQLKAENENLELSSYADGGFVILTPYDNSYQTILTSTGKNACTITEARMMWPGR
ncbi:hypothetical protein OAI02_03600 [Candidatus Pseudothioglobus singularis]|jgi:hypothetical protein|nr:hypothetical protein [Candidatus Pseudothioglobus singularis]MDB4847564.1 hypothetical protein [Candidatus Pseudothioglobus singularis]